MNIAINNINRSVPAQIPAAESGVSASVRVADGWKTAETGVDELTRTSAEMSVDEAALRRDDPLGNLVARAFGGAVPLPDLELT